MIRDTTAADALTHAAQLPQNASPAQPPDSPQRTLASLASSCARTASETWGDTACIKPPGARAAMAMSAKEVQVLTAKARNTMDTAKKHSDMGLAASASTMLTIEMLKVVNTLEAYGGGEDDEARAALKAKFEEMKAEEQRLAKETHVRMQVFGMVYKEGQLRKDLKLRLWVMDGAKVSYYKLGESTPKGFFMVHMIKECGPPAEKVASSTLLGGLATGALLATSSVEQEGGIRQYQLKVDLYSGRSYTICCPDENSLHVWDDAFKHFVEDHVYCQVYIF